MLKNCPFCGKPGKWKEFSNSYGTGASGMEPPDIGVECCNRLLRGPTMEWKPGGYYSVENATKLKLAAEWNKRA